MINWLKKDLLVHGLILVMVPIFFGILFVIGIFVYAFRMMQDPNYVEFGPFISFYESRACASSSNGNCQSFIGQAVTSIFKNNPPTLANSLGKIVKVEAKDYPQNPYLWQCEVGGRIIEDNNEKLILKDQEQTNYKCWPK